MIITVALLLASSIQDRFFPGAVLLPNPKPEDCIIITIPGTTSSQVKDPIVKA